MNNKKISVCIATYNGEEFISEQLDSILIQLRPQDEIIVSDDSSTDKTIEIIKAYKDNRIKILENQKFKSPIFNFENALKEATGEIIFLADQDDKWIENKVVRMLQELENYDLVVSDCYWFGNTANGVTSNFEFRKSKKGFLKNLYKNSYLGNCMAFRKEVLSKAIPFPKDIPMHDIWIGLVSDAFFRVSFINERLSYWRRHEKNATKLTDNSSPNNIIVMINYRLVLIKNILRLILKNNKRLFWNYTY